MTFFGVRNIAAGEAPQSFDATSVSTEMIDANNARKGIWVQNTSNKTVYLAFGSNPAVVGKGIRLVKDQIIVLGATILPIESINVISVSGDSNTLLIQEWL